MTEQTKDYQLYPTRRPADGRTDLPAAGFVRATHHFLSEQDILALKSEVRSALAQIPELYAFSEREKFSDLSVLPMVRTKRCSFRRIVSAGK